MSAQMKNSLNSSVQKEEEEPENNEPVYNFNEDESRRFVYHEKQISVEPEDHLFHSFDISPERVQPVVVKQEELNHLSYQNRSEPLDILKLELESIRRLQNQCRLVEQIIFASSKEPIYDYDIGFESNDEQPQEITSRISFSTQGRKKDKNYSLINISRKKIQNSMVVESSESEEIKQSIKLQQHNSNVFLKINENTIEELEQYPWVLDILVSVKEEGVTNYQKNIFLRLFTQLQCMKKKVVKILAESNKNQHKCNICNQIFASGRKLGGHMSRKHPGFSYEYFLKKEMHRNKKFQRSRREYFKNQKSTKGVKMNSRK